MKKIIIIAIISTLVIAGGGISYVAFFKGDGEQTKAPSETINFDPPTKEEESAGNAQKATNDAVEAEIQKNANSDKATVLVSDAAQYADTIEVRAYVSNAIEDGGTCTTVLTKSGSNKVEKVTTAFKDSSSTQCGAIDIPRSSFSSAGEWSGSVTYASESHNGTSKTFSVNVQ